MRNCVNNERERHRRIIGTPKVHFIDPAAAERKQPPSIPPGLSPA